MNINYLDTSFILVLINLFAALIVVGLAVMAYVLGRQIKGDEGVLQTQAEFILDEVLKKEIKILESVAQKGKEKQAELLEKSAQVLDEGVKQAVSEMKKQVQTQFNQSFAKTQSEIDQYKQEQIQKIEENAQKLTREAVRIALPEITPSEDHTQIVLDALDQAKKEGFKL